MKAGKVSNTILKRSVLKLIKKRGSEVLHGPGIGLDCAEITGVNGFNTIMAVSGSEYGVYRVSNNIAAAGGRCTAIMCSIMMPEEFDEGTLKTIVRHVESQCEELGLSIAGGNTMVNASVNSPVVNITGIGRVEKDDFVSMKNVQPDEDIIVTRWIGAEGVQIISRIKEKEILKLYRRDLIEKACGDVSNISVAKDAAIAAKAGIIAMSDVSEGGIFASLWNLSEAGGVGFDVDFKKIPVRQEIIEICEIFDINPYEMMSSGCLLMTSKRGYDIVKLLEKSGIDAVIIGRTTSGNDKILRNEDEIRYLDPPKRDEIYKIY